VGLQYGCGLSLCRLEGAILAFIPVPNGVSVCFLFTQDTQHWQFCVTARKTSGSVNDTFLEDVSGQAYNFWTAALKALLSTTATLSEIVVTNLTSEGASQNRQTVDEAGTASGSAMPNSLAAVVSQRTAKRGRSYRGRAFVGGLPTSVGNTTTTFGSTFATALVDAFELLLSNLISVGAQMVVASKMHNGVATDPAATNDVLNFVVDLLFDNQRRRLAGRGT